MHLIEPSCVSRRRRGAALMLVLVGVAMVLILALGYLAGQSTTQGVVQNITNHARARAIAESAIELTRAEIASNSAWRQEHANGAWVKSAALYGGTYTVTVEDGIDTNGDGVVEGDGDIDDDPADAVTITVVARFEETSHTVRAQIHPTEDAVKLQLLMIVPDANSLSDAAAARRDLIKSWGYEVVLLSASASASSYNAALADADVVYVIQESSGAAVGAKLNGAEIGVVTEQGDLYPALGLAAYWSTYESTSIDIVDNSHYITELFSPGPVAICSSAQSLVRQTAPLAGGAYDLAHQPANSSRTLSAIELGAATQVSGVYAVGRRVALPFGASDFKFSTLNDNGRTILRRSLDWAAAPPMGPPALAHWRLDDGIGDTASDSNGAHHGAVSGGAAWTVGTVAGALNFDGVNDYIQIPNHANFQVTNALSVTAWIKANSFGSGADVDTILRKGEGNPNKWQFALKDGKPTVFLEDYDDYGIKGNTKLATGQWYHVAATWDGSKVKLYVNGAPDNGSGTSRSGPIATDTRPVYIGGRAGTTDLLHGSLDDVRFYNRALTPAEVKAMYDEGTKAQKLVNLVALYTFADVKPAPALVGHWTLDEAATGGGGLAAKDEMKIYDTARVDSYDSSRGAYASGLAGKNAFLSTNSTSSARFHVDTSASLWGHAFCGVGGSPSSVIDAHEGAISGRRLALASNVTFADNALPTALNALANEGSQSISTTQSWLTNRKFSSLTLSGSANVTVTGNVKILCTGNFAASGSARITIPAGSSLELHIGGTATISNSALIHNDSSAPQRLTVYTYNTTGHITVQDSAKVAGVLRSDGDVSITGSSEFFGAMSASDDMFISSTALVHVDTNLPSLGIAAPPAADETARNPGGYKNGAAGLAGGAAGHTATAVQLDGVNDHVEIPHHDAYLLSNGAISFWFRADAVSTKQGLVSKDSAGLDNGGQFSIWLEGGKVYAKLESKTAGTTITSATVSASQWHHVVLTFGAQGMKLYVNKALAASSSYVGALTGNVQPIAVGADASNSGDGTLTGLASYFKGRIDDVRIYNHALDLGQVEDLFAGAALRQSTLPSSVVYDTSGNGGSADLLIPDTQAIEWLAGGGLHVKSPIAIVSAYQARKLRDALALTGEMSIELQFIADSSAQAGPAPIIAYGASGSALNFAFGQQNTAYDWRLRTSTGSTAGTPAVTKSNTISTTTLQQVVISYNQEDVKVYLNGKLNHSEARTGDLSNWDVGYYLAMANDVTGTKPWLGRLYRVAIYDRGLRSFQVANVAKGLPPGNVTDAKTGFRWVELP